MSGQEIDAAARRVAARRPRLGEAVQGVAEALTAGDGATAIHQAALQQFLWWRLPSKYPEHLWPTMAEAAGELLDELGMARLARLARSERTAGVLAVWAEDPEAGAAAFRRAHGRSGVEAPDTAVLEWGSIMGIDEARARDAVERALGEAVGSGVLVPGSGRWRSTAGAITEGVMTRPLEIPPGQSLAGLVATERVGSWIDSAVHPVLQQWRSSVAKQLLNPIPPPADPTAALAPLRWLLQLADGPRGTGLTQNHHLARESVVEAVELFSWWDWSKPPRSEVEVRRLAILHRAAARLRLVRRRGRRLHTTARGSKLLADPSLLWLTVAGATADSEPFGRTVTELAGLRLLRGEAEREELTAGSLPLLVARGWSTSSGPLTTQVVGSAVSFALEWWRIFSALDEVDATWEYGTGRRLSPHTIALRPDGERMVLAYLRSLAAGPRHHLYG